jgi:nucleoside-triphosphatase THEP1
LTAPDIGTLYLISIVKIRACKYCIGEAVDTENKKRPVYVIDEIEKMGLFSKPFVNSIRAILRQGPQPRPRKLRGMKPLIVLATLPKMSGETHQLINEIKSREDCALFKVKLLLMYIIAGNFGEY